MSLGRSGRPRNGEVTGRRIRPRDANEDPESNEESFPSSSGHEKETKSIMLNGQDSIWSVAFLVDGKHFVSGGAEWKIRCWRTEDGEEVGTPMDVESTVWSIAVSLDGKWFVSGTSLNGLVTVWDAERREKVTEFNGHDNWGVGAVDVSPDGTRIATGSSDQTVCVWSLSTGQRLLGPLQHEYKVVGAKFSPNGRFIATATWHFNSVRVYDSQTGDLIDDYSGVQIGWSTNQTLAWANDSERLFSVSLDGKIHCFEMSTGTALPEWDILTKSAKCIALSNNGKFVATSAGCSVSFWDTMTHQQVGSVIDHTDVVVCMAISASYNLVIGGGRTISLYSLSEILPSAYCDEMPCGQEFFCSTFKASDLEEESFSAQEESADSKIARLEETVQQLRNELSDAKDRADSLARTLHVHEKKHECEALYAEGRVIESAMSLLEIKNAISEEGRDNKLLTDWLTTFLNRCLSTLETIGDESSVAKRDDEAVAAYSTALMLCPSTPNALIKKWVNATLVSNPPHVALSDATKFKLPTFVICQAICDVLEGDGRIKEAIDCFSKMQVELGEDTITHDERAQWELGFQQRCKEKLETLADSAMHSQHYEEAIELFSTILLLNPGDRLDVLVKRSRARASMNLWEDALSDADEAIKLDPSSYQGYERRHAALHGARRHVEAIESFHAMLSKLDGSPDERVRGLRSRYVDAASVIRRIVAQTIRHMPRVLIDTSTGRLYDKKQQAETFEALPIYSELVSSMTTQLDYARIRIAVKEFYRYVMLSHKWEHDEPLFQKVEHTTVYELESSPVNIKLQSFCSLVRSLGFRWAWSDTCCVDKVNNVVLQESLVAMFTWYRGSTLTVVYLRGVSSSSRLPGGLQGSIWNTRAWTYQEYVAAETVQFYTEDWKPYLGLTLFNHKESPAVVSEMQQATGVSAQGMAVLRPGLDRVREKLYLASGRHTTLVEDIAYSLLGIFNAAIPVIYGEGYRAVGRLLEHILTGSGDVTILAWTGRAGSYNSCLPSDLTVYNQLTPPHVPQPIAAAKMDSMVTTLHSSLPDPMLAVKLYDRLNELPSPSLASSRLRLPVIVFRLDEPVHVSGPDPATDLYVHHATTSTFGPVEIRTMENLSGTKDLCLAHPWIRPLLDQEFSHGASALDRTTQALRLVARLRQPFGALLLHPVSRVEYRRVATDSLIVVQMREEMSLAELIDNVRTVEVQ